MRSLAIEVTSVCNQRCRYCYNAWRAQDPGRSLPLEEILKRASVLRQEAGLSSVTLTGGEPFVRSDVLELIEGLNALGLRVSIISNGSATEAQVKRLAELQVGYVQITLAGSTRESHEWHTGPGSWERVLRAFRLLRASGVNAGGSFLCTKRSASEAGDLLQILVDSGVSHIAFNRFNPSGYGTRAMKELMPTRSQVISALRRAEEVAATGVRVINTMPIPQCVVDYSAFPSLRFGVCSAGHPRGEPALGADGRFRLCTVLGSSLGSLDASALPAALEGPGVASFRSAIPSFCEGCPYATSCRGGCSAAAEWVFGDPSELDPFVAQHVYEDYEARIIQR